MKENILELKTQKQFKEAFPILRQLRTDLTEVSYFELLQEMQKDGYKLFALYNNDKIVSIAGLSWRINFYNKRHLFIYDLVTDSELRSLGYGEKLLSYLQSWATEQGADYITLESGLQRTDAHRFYEDKLDYVKWCYSFRKSL
jgi:GNAT superfamily N-acetyltransferase